MLYEILSLYRKGHIESPHHLFALPAQVHPVLEEEVQGAAHHRLLQRDPNQLHRSTGSVRFRAAAFSQDQNSKGESHFLKSEFSRFPESQTWIWVIDMVMDIGID